MKTSSLLPCAAASLLLLATAARAATNDLSATVTPGYVFSSSERVTLQKLNALGTPTVAISGTVPGATISTNSIGKSHLLTNVFDQQYLSGGNNDTATIIPASLDYTLMSSIAVGGTNIIDASIEFDDLNTNIVTAATLRTNLFSALAAVTPATNDLVILADTSATSNSVQATVLAVQQAGRFTSANLTPHALSTTTNFTVAHNLGRTPTTLRWTLVCTTAEYQFKPGDELPATSIESFYTANTAWADGTNCFWYVNGNMSLRNTNGAVATLTPASWLVKCYAW